MPPASLDRGGVGEHLAHRRAQPFRAVEHDEELRRRAEAPLDELARSGSTDGQTTDDGRRTRTDRRR